MTRDSVPAHRTFEELVNTELKAAFATMWMLMLFLWGTVALGQPDGPARQTERSIGLVEVPGLFGMLEPDKPVPSAPERVQQVALRSRPTLTAPIVERVARPEGIEAREHGYEHLSAVVYGIQDGWYLVSYSVGRRQGNAWLSPKDAGRFRSLGELLKDGLAYLTPDWDGRLFVQPERRSESRTLSTAPAGADVVVADVTRDDQGVDWFLVIVLQAGRCRGATHPPVVAAGWVPAYSTQGKLQAWFRSRGC